jgi:hypothetical protein
MSFVLSDPPLYTASGAAALSHSLVLNAIGDRPQYSLAVAL